MLLTQKVAIYESFIEKMGAMGTVTGLAGFIHFFMVPRDCQNPLDGICSPATIRAADYPSIASKPITLIFSLLGRKMRRCYETFWGAKNSLGVLLFSINILLVFD